MWACIILEVPWSFLPVKPLIRLSSISSLYYHRSCATSSRHTLLTTVRSSECSCVSAVLLTPSLPHPFTSSAFPTALSLYRTLLPNHPQVPASTYDARRLSTSSWSGCSSISHGWLHTTTTKWVSINEPPTRLAWCGARARLAVLQFLRSAGQSRPRSPSSLPNSSFVAPCWLELL